MSGLGPEKITTQQRFNLVQEDLDLIYSRLKETADELQASRTRVRELEAQVSEIPDLLLIAHMQGAEQAKDRVAELSHAYSVQGLAIEELTAERDRYRAALEDALIAVRDGRLDQAEIILAAVLR